MATFPGSRRENRLRYNIDYQNNEVKSIDGYIIEKSLGQGGYGKTFIASKNGVKYVVKKMATEDAIWEFNELNDLGSDCVNHLNCPIDLYRDGETSYLITEYINGKDLTKYENRTMPELFYNDMIGQMLQALITIHSKQITHNDIKPGNIIYEESTNNFYLIDFGISSTNAKMATTNCMGTPLFISPYYEEYCDRRQKTPLNALVKNDIFALAVTVFLMIEHQFPFAFYKNGDYDVYDYEQVTEYKNATDFQIAVIDDLFREGMTAKQIYDKYFESV